MRHVIMVMTAVFLSSVAHADPSPYDDLMKPTPLVMAPKSDHKIDMFAAAREQRHDRLWRAINVTALALSTAALACDWGSTRTAASSSWTGGIYKAGTMERNPIMGTRPSVAVVDAYFATSAALNVALWLVLPNRYKAIVPIAITAVESNTVWNNSPNTGMCGF